MARLGVNIDHVASLRQARYRDGAQGAGEPDPVRAVHEAEVGGADVITMHLREDRRHVNDRDVELCRAITRVKFNLEMAATDAMVAIAVRLRPHMCTLVPEGRREVTTEGGLETAGHAEALRDCVARLHDAGVLVSAFVDADERHVEGAAGAGFDACELHTGPYAGAFAACGGDTARPALRGAFDRLVRAAESVSAAGMVLNAGHALTYANVAPVGAIRGMHELHIGHSIIARAVYSGLRAAVSEMRAAIRAGEVRA